MQEKPGFEELPSLSIDAAAENGSGASPATAPVNDVSLTKNPEKLPVRPLSVLSTSIVVKGEISAGDEIVVHGTVEGTIAHDMKRVIVGKEGIVRALIHANVVTVQGEVDGDIHGNELVELLEGAKVEGDIFCREFRVEKGAQFNGTVNMAPRLKNGD